MRTVVIAVLFISPAALWAQLPDAGTSLLAGQVSAEIRSLTMLATRLPAAEQQAIRRACDQAAAKALLVQRSMAANEPPVRLAERFRDLDREIDQLVARVRQVAPTDVALQAQAARADFACNQLGAALFLPDRPGAGQDYAAAQREQLRRLTRSLNGQSRTLLVVARAELPENVWGRHLEDDVREFDRAADRLSDCFDGRPDRLRPRDEFIAVQTRWDGIARHLNQVGLARYPQLRLQAATIDRSVKLIGRAIGPIDVPIGPPVGPPIGFPIGNDRERGVIALGAGEGGAPVVRLLLDRRGQVHHDFMAYDATFQGGVRVAVADVNGDGTMDVITGPGPGMAPVVRVFDGRDLSVMGQFFAYDPKMPSGVWVAAGDFTGDGKAEIVTGAGDNGGPHVRVFDGATGQVLSEFFAFNPRWFCGVRVAVADVDGDRMPDIICGAGPGVDPFVRVFNGRNSTPMAGFLAYERNFRGGVFVAAADVTGVGRAQIVTGPGANGGPHVRLFDGFTGQPLGESWPYDRTFLGGVRVGLLDSEHNRRTTLLAAPGPGGPPLVRLIDGQTGNLVHEFMAFDPTFTGGVWVAGN